MSLQKHETWVSFKGTPEKAEATQGWVLRKKICKPELQSSKRMFSIFSRHQGPVAVDVSTVTQSRYAGTGLLKVVQEMSGI